MKKKILSILTLSLIAVLTFGCNFTGNSGSIQNDTIKIKQYKGIEVEKVPLNEVTDERMEEYIKNLVNYTPILKEVKRNSQNGDVVNIDFTGKIDGKTFPGGNGENMKLEIGSGTFIPSTDKYKGFEEQLIGHKAGDTFTITVQFPDKYMNNLGGKVAAFDVKMNTVSEKKEAKLDEEWLKENGKGAKNIDEYRKIIKEDLKKSDKDSQRNELKNRIFNKINENSEWVKKPENEINKQFNETMEQYEYQAKQNNVGVNEYFKNNLGMDKEQFENDFKGNIENTIKQKYIVKLIAEKENLTLSDEDYKKESEKFAKENGFKSVEELEKSIKKDDIKYYIESERVLDFLIDNCKQTEAQEVSSTQVENNE